MKIVRVYSGADGESHFEDLGTEYLDQLVAGNGAGPARVSRRSPGDWFDYHTAPRRQWVVFLAGVSEFETADGSVRRLGPGDVLLAEDLTGHGHVARGVGTEHRLSVSFPMPSDGAG